MTIASTKRNPVAVSGKIGAPVTNLASVTLAYAPYPAQPDTAEKYHLKSPRKTFVADIMDVVDILEGDIMVVDEVEYKVVVVLKWTSPVEHTKILMEKQQ